MSRQVMQHRQTDTHRFWRDPALPFIEARAVDDGRTVCYDRHAHATFSVGAITGGESTYWNQGRQAGVGPGAVVLMNPEDVHACNPKDEQPWSYRMFYVDATWLARVQHAQQDASACDFRPLATIVSTDAVLYRGLNALFDTLTDADRDQLAAESAAVAYFHTLFRRLGPATDDRTLPHNQGLERAAEFIDAHCTAALRLDDVCAAAGLSPSYLVRAFKTRYGMTPHAWLINRRIRYAQGELKRGRAIADVAVDAGFADQAHFQRQFKRHVAATPRQYTARLR